jgi:chemotaxis response regulator CheB
MIKKKSRNRLPPGSEPAEEEAAGALLAAEAGGLSVVGVGASAGGLEAFTQLLRGLPDEPGFAVVFVQHLAPQHDSALPVFGRVRGARREISAAQAAESGAAPATISIAWSDSNTS